MGSAGWLAGVVLLTACAPAIDRPVPNGPSYESGEVRFVAPTGWELREAARPTNGPSQLVVFLANRPDPATLLVLALPLPNAAR